MLRSSKSLSHSASQCVAASASSTVPASQCDRMVSCSFFVWAACCFVRCFSRLSSRVAPIAFARRRLSSEISASCSRTVDSSEFLLSPRLRSSAAVCSATSFCCAVSSFCAALRSAAIARTASFRSRSISHIAVERSSSDSRSLSCHSTSASRRSLPASRSFRRSATSSAWGGEHTRGVRGEG